MPWGFIYNRMLSNQNGPAADNNGQIITWATLVATYMNRHGPLIVREGDPNLKAQFAPVVQCPEADQGRQHVVSYAMNCIVGVSPTLEHYTLGLAGALFRPPTQTQLLKETALVWDTGVLEQWLMDPRWRVGVDIDGARFAVAQTPQFRFYTVKDIFAHISPGIYGQNKPVFLDVGPVAFRNVEPGFVPTYYPYQGNLRFRHQKETTCNVGFSDGSVRQFAAKMNPDKTVKSHDAIRRYFMIKWPTGVKPHPGYPS